MSDQLALGTEAARWVVERSDGRFYYGEGAEVVWIRDRGQAATFDEDRATALARDLRSSLGPDELYAGRDIKAVPLVKEDEAPLIERLASELAWKLLHPQQLAEGSIYALMDYREEAGERCPQVVVDAIEQIRGTKP
jgi:hypothetical protein